MEMLVMQKLCAFRKALKTGIEAPAWRAAWQQIVVVGDGEFEMHAANDLNYETPPEVRMKTIKMFNEPTLVPPPPPGLPAAPGLPGSSDGA